MRQYPLDDCLVFDGRNCAGVAVAELASAYIDAWAATMKTRLSLWAQLMAT